MNNIAFKLAAMIGEKFEFELSQMANIAFKLATMIGENFISNG